MSSVPDYLWHNVQHMSLQAGIGYLLTRDRPHVRRHLFPLFIAGVLSAYGLFDYCLGIATDWWHLPSITAPQEGTLYTLDYVCAYLLVNTLYQAYVRPQEYSIVADCGGPMLLFAMIQNFRASPCVNGLRPLLVGFLPMAMAAFKQKAEPDWNLVLWTRVAAPAYALRFLLVSDAIWWSYVVWIGWNLGWLLVKCNEKKETYLE